VGAAGPRADPPVRPLEPERRLDTQQPIDDDEFSFKNVASHLPTPTASAGAPAVPASQAVGTAEAPPGSGAGVPATTEASTPAPKPAPDGPSGGAQVRPGPPANPQEIPVALTRTTSSPRHMLEAWLALMVKQNASDLILRAGGRPSHRTDGRIGFLPGRVPASGALLEVLEGIMGRARMEVWSETGSVDAALHLDGLGRFRMNAYKQMGEPAVVIRRISETPPELDSLDLPTEELKRLAMRKRGLILVTGIAGSGKSTTLAAIIEFMNKNVERHVVTLEDPVELLFKEQMCVISQREVGTDTPDFQEGLRHALRQSPDVILIGEMRDAETVIAALDAVETGHLVLSTLHTVNAPQTVDRILSFFPSEQHAQVRSRLSDNLAGVLSQRLIPRTAEGGGLVPAFELLTSTPHVRELLEEGKTGELARVIEQGNEKGLVSFNQSLRGLVHDRKVELKDALAASDRPEELVLALRGITGSAARVEAPAPVDPRVEQRRPAGGDGLRMAEPG